MTLCGPFIPIRVTLDEASDPAEPLDCALAAPDSQPAAPVRQPAGEPAAASVPGDDHEHV